MSLENNVVIPCVFLSAERSEREQSPLLINAHIRRQHPLFTASEQKGNGGRPVMLGIRLDRFDRQVELSALLTLPATQGNKLMAGERVLRHGQCGAVLS